MQAPETAEHAENLHHFHHSALELVLGDLPLKQALEQLMITVEARSTAGVLASVLLMDEEGKTLRHGAAPSLPKGYNDAIDGIQAGPGVGSCGTAAYLRRPVYVEDIAVDPLWTDFAEVALSHGLRACWSTPIVSRDNKILGTFALYYRQPRQPTSADLEIVELVTRSAALIIARAQAEQRLRETEERYRLAARATRDAIWDWNLVDDHVLWNEALQVAYGHGSDTVRTTGEWWLEHIHPSDRDRVSASIHAAIDGTADSWTGEYRFRRADGTYAYVFDRGHIIRDEQGRAVRVIGAMLDQTERRRAEAILAEREERLRLATEHAEVGFWDVDTVRDILVWPARVKAMFGISPDAPVTMEDFYNGLHPEDRDRTSVAYAAAADHELRALYDVEYRTIGKEDGLVRWVAAKGRGVFDDAGHCVRVIGTAIDVTARKRMEATLLELNETLENKVAQKTAERNRLWSMTNLLMAVVGSDALIREVNPAWPAMLGWTSAEAVGRHVAEFIQPEDAERAFEWSKNLQYDGHVEPLEIACRCKDNAFKVIAWSVEQGEGSFHCVGRDVTAEKEQAAALRAAEDTLRQSQKMEAVGQLTGGIAHDFNNMLAVVIGSLDLLQRRIGTADPRLKRYAEAATDGARRAATLTQRLLAFSRQQPLKPEVVDLNKIVANMSELLSHSLGGDIRLETVLAGGLWRAHADPNQVENAILNLAINSRDAMPDGGRLTVETQNAALDSRFAAAHLGVPAGQYVLLAVTDTGKGMSPEIIAKAFDPFFTTKDVGKGTGLGLSQVYGFVKQSGGHVKIYSEPNQGTTIKIYLPRHLASHDEAIDSPVLGELPRGQQREVILVVEDEAMVRQFSVDALGELGYRVLEADGAVKALELLDAHPEIALVFTDVVMPEVNGAKLVEEARRRRPLLKVLFTTGYTRNAVVHNGVLDPGVDLIGKPFTVEQLAAKIRQVLDGDE